MMAERAISAQRRVSATLRMRSSADTETWRVRAQTLRRRGMVSPTLRGRERSRVGSCGPSLAQGGAIALGYVFDVRLHVRMESCDSCYVFNMGRSLFL
jgi:hypothetical protein